MTVTLEEVLTLVSIQLGKRNVSGNDHFFEDLGAESIDIVNIMAASEDKFGISLPGTDLSNIRTVSELYELLKNKHLP